MFPAAGRLPEAPVVGDFVFIENGLISALEPRRSAITRVAPGGARQVQVLAANVDLLFIVSGLDGDFNLRRLERYLVLALSSGAQPVFGLTKADLCPDSEAKAALVRVIGPGFRVIPSSSADGAGAELVRGMISPGLTAALIGSSGAGKSTLLNLLLGDQRQTVSEVRASDSRGRHTTTHRQMFRIPGGGWLIDQPGLREIQLYAADEESIEGAFPEIAELAAQCRFRDCRHEGEPGCAVRDQVDPQRLKSFGKLRRETERADEEFDIAARIQRKGKLKAIHKAARNFDRQNR
jgi:ribosome biogenesis GTPase